MRIGCHLSVSRGFDKMIERALDVGAEVVQYFPKNPKSYRPRPLIARRTGASPRRPMTPMCAPVCHSPYVTNLSTPDDTLRTTSVASIINDLEIADAYRTDYLVVHCGKHVGEGRERGIELMVDSINRVLEAFSGETMFLLENTAGQGTELGSELEEIVAIHERIEQKERVGVCFDTCHAFAAGVLDFDDWDGFRAAFFDDAFFPLVKVIRPQRQQGALRWPRNRHELLGQGEIGGERLARFLSEPRLQGLPVIIETPVEDELEYADEIKLAQRLRGARAGGIAGIGARGPQSGSRPGPRHVGGVRKGLV